MSYNGSGVFTINTAGQPVITGTTISSTTFNSLTADLATGLTTALTKDGQSTPTANIGMGAFKITNLAAGTVASDAARLDQVQGGAATFITVTGTDTLTGTVVPALSAYATGNQFSFLVANTNTGAVTINVDGIGSKAITRTGTTALVAGDMVAGQAVEIIYDGTRFQLVNGNSFTNLKVSGTLGVTGVATFTAQPIVSSLTASLPVFTDASKGLVSNTMTGTGSVVMSISPTLVTPALGTPTALVGTNITGTASGLTAGTVTTNANLTGMVTSVGNAATVVTNANLTGEATSSGSNAVTLTNSAVIGKVITGYVSGAGTVAATDTILQAIQKLNGNDSTNANLTGAVTSVGNVTSLGSFTSAQLATALTDETGTGANVFATSPTLVTPVLGAATATTLAVSDSINTPNTFGFKNRIINGGMVIDQRNAGASVTVNSGTDAFAVDRFPAAASGGGVFTMQRSTTSATNFSNSLLATVTTADSSIAAGDYYGIQHKIEGFNTADFNSGTANAKTITLSFWVRSSIIGTYGLGLGNNANNRWYPASYAISSANTWEQKSITLTCDTSGTWDTTTGTGLWLWLDLGSGSTYQGTANAWTSSTKFTVAGATQWIATNSATFYITGVQLEKGSTATSFDFRDYGRELIMCQRYCQALSNYSIGVSSYADIPASTVQLRVTMRAAPTLSSGALFTVSGGSAGTPALSAVNGGTSNPDSVFVINSAGNWSVGNRTSFTGILTAEL